MKKMMMALAALCVAGAASAVTWNWTTPVEEGTAGQESCDLTTTLYKNSSATYVFSAQVATSASNNWAFVLKNNSDDGAQNYPNQIVIGVADGKYKVGVSGWATNPDGAQTGTPAFLGDSAYTNTDALTVKASGTTQFAFTLTRIGENHETTVTLYIDGKQVCNFSGNLAGGPINTFEKNGTAITMVGGVAQVGVVADLEDIKALPEPTALALLALGVAGLALRRKAA